MHLHAAILEMRNGDKKDVYSNVFNMDILILCIRPKSF